MKSIWLQRWLSYSLALEEIVAIRREPKPTDKWCVAYRIPKGPLRAMSWHRRRWQAERRCKRLLLYGFNPLASDLYPFIISRKNFVFDSERHPQEPKDDVA